MDLYIVYSPYQLVVAVNLAIHENRGRLGELIIASRSRGMEQYSQSVAESGVFERVHIANEQELLHIIGDPKRSFMSKVFRRIGRNILNLPFILSQYRYNSMPFYGKQYHYIYFPVSGGYLDGFVLKQVKNGAKFYLIEDGVGDRVGSRDKMPLIFKIFGWLGAKSYWHCISAGYLFAPEMTISDPYFPIVKQIRPQENEISLFKEIFQYDPERDELSKYEYIYFSQYGFRESALIEKILPHIPSLAIKRHPSSNEEYGDAKLVESVWPIEICNMFWDLEEKVFISPYSAVLFNPKYILDREPYVIFTYKLLPLCLEDFHNTNFTPDEITKKTLIDHYCNSKKIFIPETMDELHKAINTINNMKEKRT